MQGQPTRLTEICELLGEGRLSWPEARNEILHYPLLVIELSYPSDAFPGLPSFDYGTWDEVEQCYCKGLLTEDEYGELLEGFTEIDDARLSSN